MNIRRLIFRILRWSMLPAIVRELIQRRRVTIILYHDPAPETLRKHLRVLKSKYNIIPLRSYVDVIRSGTTSTLPTKPLVVTLDDGHAGNYRLKEILSETQVPVTIFLCSGIVGTRRHFWFKHGTRGSDTQKLKRLPHHKRLEMLREVGFSEEAEFDDRQGLSSKEIEDLMPLVDFQSHTRFHALLPTCDARKAREEIELSKRELEERFGLNVYALSYPNGDYSLRDVELARAAGYECAITVDPGFNTVKTDPFRLRRICIDDDADEDELLVKVSGVWSWLKKLANRQSWGYVQRPFEECGRD